MGKLFAQRCARLGSQNEFKIVDDIARAEAMGQHVVRLNLGEPDNDSADNINECAIANIKRGNTHYCDPQGVIAFRESVARFVRKPEMLKCADKRGFGEYCNHYGETSPSRLQDSFG